MRISGFFFVLASLAFADVSSARSDELVEMSAPLSVTLDGTTVSLESLIIKKADASGRLPIALIANGEPTVTGGTAAKAANYAPWVRELARRGWLAAVVMRRGYGQSEGPKPAPLPCQADAFSTWASAAADDLQAAINAIAQRPDADPSRVMVVGPSSAGIAAVALSARNPRGLVAVIAVSAGLRAESNCPLGDILVDAYRRFGTRSRVPNLWIYAKSDPLINPDLADRMHVAFLGGGGDVKFEMFFLDGDVGQAVFGRARQPWFMQMDGFLRAQQLPTWTQADVTEIVRKLNIAGSYDIAGKLGDEYFSSPGEKALARSTTVQFAEGRPAIFNWSGASTIENARKSVLAECQKHVDNCVVVMENFRWVGDTP
jgi:dienelactone hydrolase